jgi:hypothetical protein
LRGDETAAGVIPSKAEVSSVPEAVAPAGLNPTPVSERSFEWQAVNEVTDKLARESSPTAIGWTTLIEGRGWFGRVRDERADWSFGPSTRPRARKAVEGWIEGTLAGFDKIEGEATWIGNCSRLVNLGAAP